MALTPKTAEVHNLRRELDAITEKEGGISSDRVKSFLEEKGVDPAEFKGAWKEFKDTGYELDRPGFMLGRLTGRAIGETVEGVARILAPKSVEEAAEKFFDKNLSEGVKRTMSEVFDPYHGDGLIEPFVGELASILIPYTGGLKIYKGAKKLLSNKQISHL